MAFGNAGYLFADFRRAAVPPWGKLFAFPSFVEKKNRKFTTAARRNTEEAIGAIAKRSWS